MKDRTLLGLCLWLCVSCSADPQGTKATGGEPKTTVDATAREVQSAVPVPPTSVATASAVGDPVTPPSAEPEGFVRDGVCFPRAVKMHVQPTDAEAVAAFRRGWKGCIRPDDPSMSSHARAITDSIDKGEHKFVSKKAKCRTLKAALEKSTSGLSPKLMLLGQLASLERDGDCFSVFYAGGMKMEVEGILDAKDLRMYFAWIVPEG